MVLVLLCFYLWVLASILKMIKDCFYHSQHFLIPQPILSHQLLSWPSMELGCSSSTPFTTDLVFWLRHFLFIGLYWEKRHDKYSSCRSGGMPFDAASWIEYSSRIRRYRCRSSCTFVWSDTLLAIAEFLIFVFGPALVDCLMVLAQRLAPSSRPLIQVDLCSSPCRIWPPRSRISRRTSVDSALSCQESSAHQPLSYRMNHILCYVPTLSRKLEQWAAFQTQGSFREFLSNWCRATLVCSRHTASRPDSRPVASFWCMSCSGRPGSKPPIWARSRDFGSCHLSLGLHRGHRCWVFVE